MSPLSRREFVVMAGAVAATTRLPAQVGGRTLRAGEIVDRIKKQLGIPWNEKTFRDLFHLGGPETEVHGIAASFGGNFRVMQLAEKRGLNMLIVHEPTFYSDADVVDWVKDDPMYKWKLDWGNRHNMVVWRIHDHWHAYKQDGKADGIRTGWLEAMGWAQYEVDGDTTLFQIPPTTLKGLALYVAKQLDTGSVRVVGDPDLRVTTVATGGHGLIQNARAMQRADAFIAGEAREYDSVEYARDTVLAGAKKGGLFLSHESEEDKGMKHFAEWAQPFLPEIPVRYLPTTDEFWTV